MNDESLLFGLLRTTRGKDGSRLTKLGACVHSANLAENGHLGFGNWGKRDLGECGNLWQI
jgi:hypothetical protein